MCTVNELHPPAVSLNKTQSLVKQPIDYLCFGLQICTGSLLFQRKEFFNQVGKFCIWSQHKYMHAISGCLQKTIVSFFQDSLLNIVTSTWILVSKFSASSVHSIDVIKGQPQRAAVSFPAQRPAPVFTNPLAPHGPHTVSRSSSPC